MNRVSVIIPTYNRQDLVCEAIESALAQTYNDVEIIVVDDGSTDNTLEKLKIYDGKIKVISQKNKGCSAARNKGIRVSTGMFIAFLDSDDKWMSRKIEKQVKLLLQVNNSPCCWCNILVENKGDVRDRLSIDRLFPKHNCGVWLNPLEILATRFILFNQGVMVRREAFERAGCFDETLWVMEDYDLAIRLALLGPWVYTTEPLAICREIADNKISLEAYRNPAKWMENSIAVLDKFINIVDLNSRIKFHMRVQKYCHMLDRKISLNQEVCYSTKLNKRALSSAYATSVKFIHRRISSFQKMKTKPLNSTSI